MAIDFRTPALTRVAIESFTPGSSFSVWGWYVPEDAANEVFNATTVSTPDGSVWTYEGLRYWKADKTYSFYALYPSVTDLMANAATAAHYNETEIFLLPLSMLLKDMILWQLLPRTFPAVMLRK